MILPILVVAPSEQRGRGVYSSAAIAAGTIVEISPVLVFSRKDRKHLEKTKLYDYLFEWSHPKSKKVCVALGYLSIYNHSYNANCHYEMDFEHETITITTVKAIKRGEELFINYNAEPDDATPIWFDAK